jgi:hypothetical protein
VEIVGYYLCILLNLLLALSYHVFAVLALSFIVRVHFGARALLGLAISPAYISVGRREVFYSFKLFLPAFAALIGKGGGWGSAPLVHTGKSGSSQGTNLI